MINEEVYHVFNRGVEKRDIFIRDIDYKRFLLVSHFVNDGSKKPLHLGRIFQKCEDASFGSILKRKNETGKLVDVLAWCLMPNHFHFLLRQRRNKGISIFLQRLQISHAKYFNKVYKRSGVLFGGKFKAVHIDNDMQYTHTSRYIHLNPLDLFEPGWEERGYVKNKQEAIHFIKKYKWSSLKDYTGTGNKTEFTGLVDTKPVMNYFENTAINYRDFILDDSRFNPN